MELHPDRVRANARRADTADLIDRITVYRADLDPEALPLLMQELKARGVTPEQIVEHEQARGDVLTTPAGSARRCTFCNSPALARGKGWFRVFGLIPFLPRTLYYCGAHQPATETPAEKPV